MDKNFDNLELRNRIDVLSAEKGTCYKLLIDTIRMHEEAISGYASFDSEVEELNMTISEKAKQIESLEETAKGLKDKLSKDKDKLNNINEQKNELNKKLEFTTKELKDALDEIDELRKKLSNREESDNFVKKLLDDNKVHSDTEYKLKYELSEIKALKEESDKELERIRGNFNKAIQDRDNACERIVSVSSELDKSEDDREKAHLKCDELEVKLHDAMVKCDELNIALDKEKSLNSELSKKVKRFSNNSGGVRNYNKTLSSIDGLDVISVIGQSGSGVTTLSVSIMKWLAKRKKNACYLDLDLVYSDAESFLRQNPIVSEGMTSLEMYLNEKWDSNCIISCKFGGYISGILNNNNLLNIADFDFMGLVKSIKDSGYDYLVVDLGKIGVNNSNDEIIKDFCSISKTVIGVSTNDKFRFGRFIMDIRRCGINCKILINKCKTTIVDNYIKSILSDYTIIPFSDDVQQSNESLYSDEMTETRFNSFMKEVMK